MIKSKLSGERVKMIAFIICGVFTLIFLSFTLGSMFVYHNKGKRIKECRSYLSRVNKDLVNIDESISAYKKEREEFQAILFAKEDIASFLDMVSQFAKETNIKVVDMKTKKFEKVKPLMKEGKNIKAFRAKAKKGEKSPVQKSKKQAVLLFMPVEAKIEGDYNSIVDFLFFLENYKQLVSLTNVEIKMKRYPVLVCAFCLRIYTLEEREGKKRR